MKNFIIVSLLLFVNCVVADLVLDGDDVKGWDSNQWSTQVDGVMGGESTALLAFEDSGTMLSFTGEIVVDGGGFSSVRKRGFNTLDLSEYAGIVVRLETTEGYNSLDVNPPFGLHLQFHDRSSSYGFASAFAIPLASTSGEEISVYLPLDSFDRGSRGGFTCTNCYLDPTSINEMDIYVLFQSGPFNVRVKSITAVTNPQTFVSPVISLNSSNEINALITSTINSGGSLYNYGYKELCIEIYSSTLNSIVAASGDGTSDLLRAMACEGLNRARNQESKVDIAWTLRYTMDGILETLGFFNPDNNNGGQVWSPNTVITADDAQQCTATTSLFIYNGILKDDDTNDAMSDTNDTNDAMSNTNLGLIVGLSVAMTTLVQI